MSDMSVEEILKRAEEMKAEAQYRIEQAEKKLGASSADLGKTVTVDAEAVKKSVNEKIKEEDDIKEYVPSSKTAKEKTQTVRLSFGKSKKETDDDMRIAAPVSQKTMPVKKSFAKSESEIKMPVVFSTNTEKDEKSDLQSIPTIVSKEHIYDGYDVSSADADVGIQMSFDGFEDETDNVRTIDEAEAEKMLELSRREKVGKFRLFGPDETDRELGSDNAPEEEFVEDRQSADFLDALMSKKHTVFVKIAVTAAIGAALLALSILKDTQYMPTALSGHTAYFVCQLALYAAALGVNINIFAKGFNLKRGISFDFILSVFAICTMCHTVGCAFFESLLFENAVLLTPAACFALAMSQAGKHRMLIRIIDNFEFITSSEEKYTVENITNSVDAEIITRSFVEEKNPVVKTSVKTDFATNFLEISCKNEPADKICFLVGGIGFLASLVLLVIVGIVENFYFGINAAMCSFGLCIPVSALFLTNDLLTDVCAGLEKYGSRVCGCEGAAMAASANALVMSGSELFGKDCCDLVGIKTFNSTKVDDAIIQAAAVMIRTGSPLAHVFDDIIIGKQSILPKVEGVTYEDRLGMSAWIYRRKVLVGNRNMLIHHGVNVPKESFEKKFAVKGRKALYLAVNGKINAMFVVSYSADPDLKRELKKLERSGITIIVKSCDPYINEESLSELFDLPMGYIRVMNPSSARVYDKYSNLAVEKSPAYVVHHGTAKGFVSAMRGAQITVSSTKLISFLLSFGGALGFLMAAFLCFVNNLSGMSSLSILLFHIIWSVFTAVVLKVRRIGL